MIALRANTLFLIAVLGIPALIAGPARGQSLNPAPGNQVYEFTTGNGISVQPPNATFTTFALGGSVSQLPTPNVFEVKNWTRNPTIDTTQYATFSLTPNSGFEQTITQLTFGVFADSNGPSTLEVRYSTDGFATVAGASTYTLTPILTTQVMTVAAVTTTAPMEFRFYGYNSQAPGHSLSLDNVYLTGTITPVPEPATVLAWCLAAGGARLLGRRVWCFARGPRTNLVG